MPTFNELFNSHQLLNELLLSSNVYINSINESKNWYNVRNSIEESNNRINDQYV